MSLLTIIKRDPSPIHTLSKAEVSKPWPQQNPQFLLLPQASAVFKVLNISDNQAAKPSKSQVYRPISLNLPSKEVRKTRRLSCTLQMSLGLFTSILSYCKITMPHMVRCQKNKKKLSAIACQAFSDFRSGFTVLGIDYFLGDPVQRHTDEPGFDRAAWSARSRQQAKELLPKWVKEVRKIYGEDNRIWNWYKKMMLSWLVLFIYRHGCEIQCSWSAVFWYLKIHDIMRLTTCDWLRILFRRSLRTWASHYRWCSCWYGCPLWFTPYLSNDIERWISIAAFAHPASLNEDHFRNITSQYLYVMTINPQCWLFFPPPPLVEPLLLSCAGRFNELYISIQ